MTGTDPMTCDVGIVARRTSMCRVGDEYGGADAGKHGRA